MPLEIILVRTNIAEVTKRQLLTKTNAKKDMLEENLFIWSSARESRRPRGRSLLVIAIPQLQTEGDLAATSLYFICFN